MTASYDSGPRPGSAAAHLGNLLRAPLLAGVKLPALSDLAGACALLHPACGDVVLDGDQRLDRLYIVLSGRLELFRDGRRVGMVWPGEHVGGEGLLSPRPARARLVADRPSTLLVIDRAALDALRRGHPVVAAMLDRRLGEDADRRVL